MKAGGRLTPEQYEVLYGDADRVLWAPTDRGLIFNSTMSTLEFLRSHRLLVLVAIVALAFVFGLIP